MRRILRDEKPDLLILIDFAEFNMALAASPSVTGCPVLYYISPQVWAWRAGGCARSRGA
jgi:lipid-A-disaccharide synthase